MDNENVKHLQQRGWTWRISEVSRKEKDKYDITYIWNLKYNTDEHIYKWKQTHKYREQMCGCQGGGCGSGKDWEFGISRCKMLYIGLTIQLQTTLQL